MRAYPGIMELCTILKREGKEEAQNEGEEDAQNEGEEEGEEEREGEEEAQNEGEVEVICIDINIDANEGNEMHTEM